MRLAGIEAGGTKFVVAIGDEHGNIDKRTSFPTTTPIETMAKIYDFLDDEKLDAIGLASFGPIELNKHNRYYGYITSTPKQGWENFNILGKLKQRYPETIIGFDTDVNAAMLGEYMFGNAMGCDTAIYLTIGTGIGGGAIVNGELEHGLLHPEMGHMNLSRRDDDLDFEANCQYHKSCFEGLAAGPAIEKRWHIKGQDLEENHPAWDLEAYYIAQALANLILVISPEKIILGGGVMHQKQLYPMIDKYVSEFLNGYVKKDEILTNKINDYIVEPKLKDNAGVIGAMALGLKELKKENNA